MASVTIPDPFEEASTSLPPIVNNPRKSWLEIRQAVKRSHKIASGMFHRAHQSFTFRTVSTSSGKQKRLYFLGVPSGNRDNTLMYVDIDDKNIEQDLENVLLDTRPLLESFQCCAPSYGQLSREEQLLMERKRLRLFGITSYDLDSNSGRIIFPASNSIFTCIDSLTVGQFCKEPLFPQQVTSNCTGSRIDPKLCTTNSNLLAFVCDSDIWVTNILTGHESRLTYSHETGNAKSAGVPSFVVQEEFDRYTGYWWQSQLSHQGARVVYRILYEAVDESDVEILSIVSSPGNSGSIDEYRYPRAGAQNAKTTIHLLEFELEDSGAIVNIVNKDLCQPMNVLFPSVEYLLRAGWTPDGQFVYIEVLDRAQKKIQLVLIEPTSFVLPPLVHMEEDFHQSDNAHNVDSGANIQVLYVETTDVWVHVHDLLYFLPRENENEMRFIWASEKSGFLHLYLVTSTLKLPTCSAHTDRITSSNHIELMDEESPWIHECCFSHQQLTHGDWEVDAKQVWVDLDKKLVYFTGYKDTPLELHLYVTRLCVPTAVLRLTEPGYSHLITMDSDCTKFVTVYSSISEPPACSLHSVHQAIDQHIQHSCMGSLLQAAVINDYKPPELFTYESESGFSMHGMVYKPHGHVPGTKYPTVLFTYAGPQVQLVSNAYKGMRFLRHHTLASLDYAVVVIDSRGSSHRGLQFESHIHKKLGQVEVDDQVEGLTWLASHVDFIDMSRIAIHGWSYGGYISLMGLIQRPDIFKVAVAGAPVSSWHMYDTGYTERYMGLPRDNPDAYLRGSILGQVDKFPSEENRLLIVHGLIDENVHFYHTSMLINSLIKACRPYQLQIYPGERHGIRNPDAHEHFETTLLSFLLQHL